MDIKSQISAAVTELVDIAKLKKGDIFVVGCSTSEVVGSKIGTNSDPDTASDRKSTRLNSSHAELSRMPSSA